MADTKLVLGEVEFSEFEIPEYLPFGGMQRLVVHDFPGGARNVQAMGFNHAPVSWSGMFLGPDAMSSAQDLDAIRVAGLPVQLTYFDTTLTVVVEKFEGRLERFYKVPYSISVIVVEDQSQPAGSDGSDGFDVSIRTDVASIVSAGSLIGNSGLTSALGSLSSAVGAVSNFATAATSQIQSVLGPVGAVLSQTSTLIASVQNTISSVTTLGGVLPNNPISTQAASLLSQVTATTQLPVLQNISSLATRVGLNLSNAQGSVQPLTVAGGNLFQIASQQYGDPTQWAAIAKASGLVDPALTGVQQLNIPAIPQLAGGLLGL